MNSDDATFAGIYNTALSCNLFAYCNNSPVIKTDLTGCDAMVYADQFSQWAALLASIVPALAAAKAGIIAAIKSLLAFLWNVFVVIGIIIALLVLVYAISATAGLVMERVRETVKENEKKEQKQVYPYVVYVLTRDGTADTIFYVGRTKNYKARMIAHSPKQPFTPYIVFGCVTFRMSRVVEQAILSACVASNLIKVGIKGSDMNQIRGIAKEKLESFKMTKDEEGPIKRFASLITCTAESDMLNLMGI